MATPAPSLEDLPPQRGTILELHSIGDEEFDGVLVEFVRVDKESISSTKYFCTALQDESRNMRVKAKCCRRPDIKPLELRQLLTNLVEQMRMRMVNDPNYADADEITTRLKSLLEKDPCCVPAYVLMARLIAPSRESDDERSSRVDPAIEEAIKYLYRGVANLFAYQDIPRDHYTEEWIKSELAALLARNNHFSSAVRVVERVQNDDAKKTERSIWEQHCVKGYCAQKRALKLKNHQQPEKRDRVLEATDHNIKALTIAAKEQCFGDEYIKVRMPSQATSAHENIVYLLRHHGDESEADLDRILCLSDRLLEACTTKDGTRVFLTDEIEASLTQLVSHRASLKDHLPKDDDAEE